MAFGLLNALILSGLAAVAIPPIIHILSRRRYTVVEWGAMQFLDVGEMKQRRLLIEELLLMLLRMGLIAILVFALAAPYISGSMVAHYATRPDRDVVLVLDGSASMTLRNPDTSTPESRALQWTKKIFAELSPEDKVAVVVARTELNRIRELTSDQNAVREAIDSLSFDGGRCDAPKAFESAWKLLQENARRQEQDIIFLTDGHRIGWSDDNAVSRWKDIARRWKSEYEDRNKSGPRAWFVNVRGDEKDDVPNYNLHPVRSRERAWIGQAVRFETTLSWSKSVNERPYRIRFYVDDKFVRNLPLPGKGHWKRGKIEVQTWHTFESAGSHVISIIVEPELPPEKRSDDYKPRDRLSADNRVDRAVLVQKTLPVLLVDGDTTLSQSSSTFYLERALQPREAATGVMVRTVTSNQFTPEDLERPIRKEPETIPRVLVLADIPSLNDNQRNAIESFLAKGGGVWVILGRRVQDVKTYNNKLYQDGRGWLPARLEKVAGDVKKPDAAAAPDTDELLHPAMSIFRGRGRTGLREVRFPQWWKVVVTDDSSVRIMGMLDRGDPMCVELAYKKGRVVLSAVPMDRSWDATFPGTAEFPILVHEIIHYLAGKGAWKCNLRPGQPIVYNPSKWDLLRNAIDLPTSATFTYPNGTPKTITVSQWPFRDQQTYRPGIYSLTFPDKSPLRFVVQRDIKESQLEWMTTEEIDSFLNFFSGKVLTEPSEFGAAVINTEHREDIWWILMLGVIVLLCVEIALTRRMAAK